MSYGIKVGESFYLSVIDGNYAGTMADWLEGSPTIFETESEALAETSDGVKGNHDWGGTVYRCVPVARVTPITRVKVKRLPRSERTGA